MHTGRGGIKYEDIRLGDGSEVVRGCHVTIRYELLLNRGELVRRHEESSFRVGDRSAIAGLEYGVEGMRQGGLRRIRFGPHLGYGKTGVPGLIPPDALLEFRVELLRVTSSS